MNRGLAYIGEASVTLEILFRREYDVTIDMLTPQVNSPYFAKASQGGQFVEKIMTDRAGRQFRMVFLVAFVDGEVKARLISVEAIRQLQGTSYKAQVSQFLLATCNLKLATATEYIPAYAPVVSPFNEFFFFTSQPTRAPSFK